MKILIVGGGSIGQRHLINALDIVKEVALFDVDTSRAENLSQRHGITAFTSLDDALNWKPDGAVIAVPNNLHIEIAHKVAAAGIVPLIEKPLSHSLEDGKNFIDFLSQQKARAYVVCNMRFHPAVKVLRDNLSQVGNVLYVRAQYGNYLPNMRPDADYKKLYCAHKSQGGGVILDAIHEIDYITSFFGNVKNVSCIADKRSDLDIDVEDYAHLTLNHLNNVKSEIHLDYLQQCKRRGCEIIGDKGTLIWESEDKAPEQCRVRFYNATSKMWETLYDDKQLDASGMYKELMQKFIMEISTPGAHDSLLSAKQALHALQVCMAAHASNANKTLVEID